MHDIAYFIGGTVMAGAGLLVTLLFAWLVARTITSAIWRGTGAWLTVRELEEAVKEWRERHPEKAARAKKRNQARSGSAL